MAESFDTAKEWGGDVTPVEQLIRQAASYVDVSDDLRPRVLENARDQHVRRSSACSAALLLVALIALGCGLQRLSSYWRASPAPVIDGIVCPTTVNVFSMAELDPHSLGGPDAWSVAQAFVELRNRQAQLLLTATQ
jgi:hypothetical protein